ncbi:polysaccharide lyase [Branchiibius hedensis]|uniref:polysaccharide lyase n=1 Tax=Branchiibius hedensis TaxID=672460 RepID=UPI0011B24536|nr:hypothetical protein [Branchiibius hedensis]
MTTASRPADVDRSGAYSWANSPAELITYDYFTGMNSQYGINGQTNVTLTAGPTYKVRHRVKLNTITSGTANSDGIAQFTVNGTKVLEVTNRKWRLTDSVKISTLWWHFFRGGNDSAWADSADGTSPSTT